MASKNLYLDESALVPCTDANWDILENDAHLPLRITSPISEKGQILLDAKDSAEVYVS